MSIADYSDLLGQCAEYTGRDDFAHMFPRFVSYCESKLNKRLRVGKMEAMATVTTDIAGAAEMPADLLEVRGVANPLGVPLRNMALEYLDHEYRFTAGTPVGYGLLGTTIYVVPLSIETFTVTYYARITPLTAANPTNWLLSDAPLIYLYGVSAEIIGWALASGRETESAKLQLANDAYTREVDAYEMLDRSRRFSNAQIISRGCKP